MSDSSASRDLRGLSRAVDDLFAGRSPDPVELPPPVSEPRPEVEELTGGGVDEVVWVGMDDAPGDGGVPETAPGSDAAEASDPTGEAHTETDVAAPETATSTGATARPAAPAGNAAEKRGEGTALRRALAAFVAASETERPAMAEAVRREVDHLRDTRDGGALAEAVERLVRARGDDPGALALASEMVSPGVASVFTARLREAARDEARQEELVEVIRQLGDEMVRAVADALTMTDDRTERRALLSALVALAPENQEIVHELLDDPRWFVVRNAVQVIGETGGEEAVQHLTSTLAHDHAKVRRETLVALARIGGEDASMLVLSKVEDPAAEVRAAAAMALGELGLERAQKPLLAQLDAEDDADVTVQILRALGALGDPGAVPALEKRAVGSFFSRPPTAIRVAAYRALGAIGTPHARKLIEAATDDKDAEVRGAARYIVKQFEGGSGGAAGPSDPDGAPGSEPSDPPSDPEAEPER